RGAREVEELEELSRNDNGGRDGLDRPPGRTRGPRSVQGGREGRATGGAEIASPRSSGDPYDGCPGAPASLPSRGPGPLTMANPSLLSSGSTPGLSRRSPCRRSGSCPSEARRRSPDRLSRMTSPVASTSNRRRKQSYRSTRSIETISREGGPAPVVSARCAPSDRLPARLCGSGA